MRLRLPIPRHKVSRLILPCGLMLAGLVIFLCGLVRTYHIDGAMTKTQTEEYELKTHNEYMEWWIGLPFKLGVLALGTCFVLLLFALLFDAGELSWLSRSVNYVRFLQKEGFVCNTKIDEFVEGNHTYHYRDCTCMKDQKIDFGLYVSFSCEVLFALYHLHAVLTFALCCAIGLSLFTLFSFVLILKRISQITTSLRLDEKPLAEDADIVGK